MNVSRRPAPASPAPEAPTPAAPPSPPAVLHCASDGEGLLLWAEADRPVRAGPAPHLPDPDHWSWRSYAVQHPCALDLEDLMSRLLAADYTPVAAGGTFTPTPPRPDTLRPAGASLLLPTAGRRPLPSPAAGGDAQARGPLAQWHVSGLQLRMAHADAWLRPFHLEGPTGLGLAPEWAFWWRAAALVRAMVARGAVTPCLAWHPDAAHLHPSWRPVYSSADRAAWAALQEAMPPALLPSGLRPATALAMFARAYGEVLIRGALRRNKVLAPYRKTERSETDPVRLWLAALLAPSPKRLPRHVGTRGRIRDWLEDPAGVTGPAGLVLQLTEPDPETPNAWPVAIFLERPSDPGVLLTPGQIAAAATAAHASTQAAHDRDDLQEGLQRAAALIPALGQFPVAPSPVTADEDQDGPDTDADEPLFSAAATQRPPLPANADADADTAPRPAAPADHVTLSPDQAWRLLTTPQARLRAAGVRLLVPAWWKPTALRAQLHLRSTGSGLFTSDALVQYDWRVAVGDQTLSAQDFERLVAQRTPFVRLHGQWVALPPEAAAEVARRWKGHAAQGEMAAGAALLLALQAGAERPATDSAPDSDTPPPPTLEVDADEALIATLRSLGAAAAELPEPQGFHGTLRPYQRKGLAWLAARADLGLGGILADDMGLGKTVQVLALLAHRQAADVRRSSACADEGADRLQAAGTAKGPTLIVAPTSVVSNWADEAARFAPGLAVVTHQGADRARGAELAATIVAADIVVTSYPLLLRDADALADIAWDGVILDEAQNVKNASAKQAQAARRMRGRYRLALTGTPIENALGDLWSIFTFVQPGYLGSAEAFRRRLAGPIERGGGEGTTTPDQTLGRGGGEGPAMPATGGGDEAARAKETLRRLIGPLVLRRTKAERGVADELPPRIETVERCLLTPEQAALYEAVARELLARVEESTGMGRKAAVLLALLRLKQVCNHPAHYAGDGSALSERSGKLARLVELLEEVAAEGERALVFTQFATWGRRLAAHLSDHLGSAVPVLCLDGSTPAGERARLVARFQSDGGPAVFVLSLKAGGAGLNLTAARHVFHYDRWWNPAVERQATDRAHRIGQTGTVQVHKLVCTGTLEERIDRLIREKESLAEGVLAQAASGEAWLTELNDRALRDVLTLRRAALA